jgi:hypothetical protein
MSNSKISALTGATTPLAGTEVLPIVQSSTTKQVSVANLTAGRAISATQMTLTTGNLIVASGQGIDFSATPGTGTSELLADYEEGTWTPSVGGTATYFLQSGTYTKVGRSVLITGSLVVNVLGTGSATIISGLPFASIGSPADFVGFSNFSNLALAVTYMAGSANGSSQIDIRSLLVAGTSVASNNVIGNSTRLDFAGTYSV